MRTLLTALTALMLFATPVMAGDYEDAFAAYQAGDYQKAFRLWKSIARRGNPPSMYWIGLMYAKGQGVKQSDIEAYAWWDVAAESGNSRAAEVKNTLVKYMSIQDLSDANKLAGEYWKKYVLE